MRRVHIIVEGETERDFVERLLAPELAGCNVLVDARLLGVPGRKGGRVAWSRLLGDIRRLLLGDSTAYTTTLFDFFRMGTDFPDQPHLTTGDASAKKEAVESSMAKGLSAAGVPSDALLRFLPYVQMHEFEGLLFSCPEALALGLGRKDLIGPLSAIRADFSSPEEINNRPEGAPSKRILQQFPSYKKELQRRDAMDRVGLAAMRLECPLFNSWITRLESLPELG
jgi:hypothetical protein